MVEKGIESEGGNNVSKETVSALQIQLELMQRQLEEMKANKIPQQYSAPGGMSADQFKQLIEAVKAPDKRENLSIKNFVDEKNIDPADFDEKGMLFCAPSTGYVIVDDVRQGFSVMTPYGSAIIFEFNGQIIGRDSEGNQQLNTFCSYLSKSKKEQEWLKEHRYFGLKFFESAKEAISTNAARAQKMMKYVDALIGQDAAQIFAQCKKYGLPISDDLRSMRVHLADKMIGEADYAEVHITKNLLKEQHEEELFLGDKTKVTRA